VEGADLSERGIQAAFTSSKFTLLLRTENVCVGAAAAAAPARRVL
jgi:hypothetical protein